MGTDVLAERQAAELLGVDGSRVRQLALAGRIKRTKTPLGWAYSRRSVLKYQREREASQLEGRRLGGRRTAETRKARPA
jgi:hypothetical protein